MTEWHSESALLVSSFEYSAAPKRPPPTVSERIDAALGGLTPPPRALLGDVELTWRDANRLHSIELRTGRGQWELSPLRVMDARAADSSMTLEPEYDVNRIAGIDLEVHILWDATLACMALRFGNSEPADVRWFAIADNVYVGVDAQQMLAEIRFGEVRM